MHYLLRLSLMRGTQLALDVTLTMETTFSSILISAAFIFKQAKFYLKNLILFHLNKFDDEKQSPIFMVLMGGRGWARVRVEWRREKGEGGNVGEGGVEGRSGGKRAGSIL
jgi:hypothetical protein